MLKNAVTYPRKLLKTKHTIWSEKWSSLLCFWHDFRHSHRVGSKSNIIPSKARCIYQKIQEETICAAVFLSSGQKDDHLDAFVVTGQVFICPIVNVNVLLTFWYQERRNASSVSSKRWQASLQGILYSRTDQCYAESECKHHVAHCN